MTTPTPTRIQRKRTKGWRMPKGAVYVGRPTVWGNQWDLRDAVSWGIPRDDRRAWVVAQFRREYGAILGCDNEIRERLNRPRSETVEETIRSILAGLDLACWCPLDQPCHADVLLELANGGTS